MWWGGGGGGGGGAEGEGGDGGEEAGAVCGGVTLLFAEAMARLHITPLVSPMSGNTDTLTSPMSR